MSRKHNAPVVSEQQVVPATPAPRQSPAERAAARVAARDAHRAAGGLARNAAGNPDARGLACLCGCGLPTVRDEALFVSGHDAKLRAAVLALPGERQVLGSLPFFAQAFVREAGPVAGLLLAEDGERLLDTKAGL